MGWMAHLPLLAKRGGDQQKQTERLETERGRTARHCQAR
jgi:hypothetical protein